MVEKIFNHKINLKRVFELLHGWDISSTIIRDVEAFFEDYSSGKVTRRIGTNNPANIERNVYSLKPALENIKSFDKKELERFLSAWLKDEIKKKDGTPFSHRSKKETINILKKFVKWKGKDSSPLDLLIGNKEKDPPSLTEAEMEQLYDACNNPRDRYFISVLYSSGARSEEFHNIRLSDIEMPTLKDGNNFVRIRLRGEFSKTHGRKVTLFWKHCLDAVRDYLSIRIEEGLKPEEPVFPITYYSMRKWLHRFGKRVLNKRIYYHLFRHTCATHLNKKLERHQMSVFFGWDFTSKMLDRYSNRDAVDFQLVEQKFEKVEREQLEEEILKLKSQNKQISEGFVKVLNEVKHLRDKIINKTLS